MSKIDKVLKAETLLADKGLSSRSYGFSSTHVWMWEMDYKEGWAPKNWSFWIVVLEKTLESPLDSKEIQTVNLKENQPWIFIGGTDAEAPKLGPPDAKGQLLEKTSEAGKDWGQEENGAEEDEMVGWHHWLNGQEFEQTQGDGGGQGILVCCSPRGHKVPSVTERMNNRSDKAEEMLQFGSHIKLTRHCTFAVTHWVAF